MAASKSLELPDKLSSPSRTSGATQSSTNEMLRANRRSQPRRLTTSKPKDRQHHMLESTRPRSPTVILWKTSTICTSLMYQMVRIKKHTCLHWHWLQTANSRYAEANATWHRHERLLKTFVRTESSFVRSHQHMLLITRMSMTAMRPLPEAKEKRKEQLKQLARPPLRLREQGEATPPPDCASGAVKPAT